MKNREKNGSNATGNTNLHTLIRQTKNALGKASTDRYGRLNRRGDRSCLDFRVSKEALPRALSIMNELLGVLEGKGFLIEISKDGYDSTQVVVGEERVRVFLIEEVTFPPYYVAT